MAPELLPTAELERLIGEAIGADDSEQRSLAILEVAQAPIEQSLEGLLRILRENSDGRSRGAAVTALQQLPGSPAIDGRRRDALERLSQDLDANVAQTARVALTAGRVGILQQ